MNALEVGALDRLRLDVRVRDVVADKTLLAADVTLVGHDRLLEGARPSMENSVIASLFGGRDPA
jgi:hypothetical protein